MLVAWPGLLDDGGRALRGEGCRGGRVLARPELALAPGDEEHRHRATRRWPDASRASHGRSAARSSAGVKPAFAAFEVHAPSAAARCAPAPSTPSECRPGSGMPVAKYVVGVRRVVVVEAVRPVVGVQHLRRLVDDHDVADPCAAARGQQGPDRVAAHRLPDRPSRRSSPSSRIASPMSAPCRSIVWPPSGPIARGAVAAAIERDDAVSGLLERRELRLPAGRRGALNPATRSTGRPAGSPDSR